MNAISGYDFVKAIISRNKNYPVEELLDHAGNAECDYLELKASVEARPDECNPGEKPSDMYWNIAKEIIAMINTRGGILIIGVTDDASHDVVPLEGRDAHGYFKEPNGRDEYYRKAINDHIVPSKRMWTYRNKEFQTDRNLNDFLEICELNYLGHTLFAYLVKPCAADDFVSVTTTHVNANGLRLPGPEELYRRLSGSIGKCECLTTYAQFREHLKLRKVEDEKLAAELDRHVQMECYATLNTLPQRNHDFVGREEELDKVSELISRGRIPILHGEGGVGKTELACEFAYRHRKDFTGGCLFVDMTGIFHFKQLANFLYDDTRIHDALGPVPDDANRTNWIFTRLLDHLRRGNILVILDNLENVKALTYNELANSPLARQSGGNNRVCLIATARDVDEKMFPENGRESVSVIELNALDPLSAAKLLCSRLPHDLCMSDEDRKAVTEIVEQLGRHAWRTEITGGYLSQNLQDYGNPPFISYLRELKERKCSPNFQSDSFRKNGPSTEQLLEPTITKLKARGAEGRQAITLAECISKFPLDGITEGPLDFFWDHLIRHSKDDRNPRKALDLLSRYALVSMRHASGRIRMHQLTRDYFRGRTATTAKSVSRAIASDPNCPVRYWAELARENLLMDYCPWNRLPGSVNRDIVLTNPAAFAAKIRWCTLDGYALADILSCTPALAKRIKSFEPLYDNDPESPCMAFAQLLAARPDDFVSKCDFSRLKCRDVVYILKKQPQLLPRCLPTMKAFSSHEWASILARQPDILADDTDVAAQCPWDKFDADDWARLITHQPRFKDDPRFLKDYDLRNFPPFTWAQLIKYHGDTFLNHPNCPRDRIANDPGAIVELLTFAPWTLERRHPDGSRLIPFALDKVSPDGWVRILKRQPNLQALCSELGVWKSLSGKNEADLLSECPKFIANCDLSKLDGNDWAQILDKHPELAQKDPAIWRQMAQTPHDIFLSPLVRVLYAHPEFADSHREIDYASFSLAGKRLMLSRMPSLRSQIDTQSLPPHEWARLVMADPSPTNVANCPFDKINDIEKAVIAVLHPQLEGQIKTMSTLTRNLLKDKNRVQAIYDLFWDLDEARMTCNASKIISAATALSWVYFTHGLCDQARRYAVILRKCLESHGDSPTRKPIYVTLDPKTVLHNVSTMVNLRESAVPDWCDAPTTIFLHSFARSQTRVAKKLVPLLQKTIKRNHAKVEIIDGVNPGDRKFQTRFSAARAKGSTALLLFQEPLHINQSTEKIKQALQAFHADQSRLTEEIPFDRLLTVPPMFMSEIPSTSGEAVLRAALASSRQGA